MTREHIQEEVIKLLAEHLGRDKAEIKPECGLIEDLSADSLDAVEITMMMEEEFGIEINDDDASNFITVKDIIDHLEKRNV